MKKLFFISLTIIAIGGFIFLNSSKNMDGTKIIFTDKAPKPIGPYSQAVLKGNILFVSGQIAINPVTNQLDTSVIENETKQVMENLNAILEEAKMNTGDITKTTIYLTDLKNFKTVNEVYGTYFKGNPPARETVQVAALPKGAKIEISVIAIK